MSAATNYIAKADAEEERVKSEAKQAKALRTLLGEAYPDEKPKFDAMGLEDLNGTFEGRKLKDALAAQVANMQATQAHTALNQQTVAGNAATQDQLARGLAALPGLTQSRQQMIPVGMMGQVNAQTMPPPAQGAPQQQALAGIMAQNPMAADQIANALKAQQGLTGGQGVEWIRNPDTGKLEAFGRGNTTLPVAAARSEIAAAGRTTPADRRAALDALYGKGGVGGLVDKARVAQQKGDLGTLREIQSQIQQWQAVLGRPVAAGEAKSAVATGKPDDPLGLFQ